MNAIVLAGGRGTRLEPWHAPKCLMPINGVTILHRLLSHIATSSVDGIAVCTGYRARDVEASVRAHAWSELVGVSFSNVGEDAPMGARLHKARELTDGGRALVVYGDELADVDVDVLLKQHEGRVLTFTACADEVPGGTVTFDNDEPYIVEGSHRLVNIGFVVVEPVCWQHLQPADGVSDWINRCARRFEGKVGVYHHEGRRATVNTLADLRAAEEIWR